MPALLDQPVALRPSQRDEVGSVYYCHPQIKMVDLREADAPWPSMLTRSTMSPNESQPCTRSIELRRGVEPGSYPLILPKSISDDYKLACSRRFSDVRRMPRLLRRA